MRLVAALLLLVAGCDAGLVGEGGECTTSEECASGLLCDFSKTPHVCAKMGSLTTDFSTPPRDLSIVDLAGADLSAAMSMDLASGDVAVAPPDLTTTPPDLTPVD